MNNKQIMMEIDRLCKEYDMKEEKKAKAKEEKNRRYRHHHHHHHHSNSSNKAAEEPVNSTVENPVNTIEKQEPVVAASEENVAARNIAPTTTLTVNLKPEMVAEKMVTKIISNDTAIKDSVEAAVPQNVSQVTVNVDTQSVIDGVATKLLEKTDAASEEEVAKKMNSISMDDFINMMVSSIIEVISDNGKVVDEDEAQVSAEAAEAVEISADDAAEGDNSAEGNETAPAEAVVETSQAEAPADSKTAEAVATEAVA